MLKHISCDVNIFNFIKQKWSNKEDGIEEAMIIELKHLNYIFIKIFTSTKPYRYWI
jgi:hypothetical protein